MSSLLRRPGRDADAAPPQFSVGTLADNDRTSLRRLVERDPLVNVVLASRLEHVTSLSPRRLGGTVTGVRDASQRLVGAAFHGGNLLPIGGDDTAWAALGDRLADDARLCTSIVGRADAVGALWSRLEPMWGSARSVRENQPLLATSELPADALRHPQLRRVTTDELEVYLPAAAAMFSEELGASPYRTTSAEEYRRRVAALIRDGRAFAIFDTAGDVVFKADFGAVSSQVCQVQGVWTRPSLRGRGIGTQAMAAVLGHALKLAPTASLYVNHYNEPARRMYHRLGMDQVGTLSTVLF